MRFAIPLITFFLTACSVAAPVSTLPAASTATHPPAATTTSTPTLTPTVTATLSPAPSIPPSPTETASPTPIPTYAILRGIVNVAQAVCHYGPGKPYLYKYGVIQGNRLEIIRRVQPGTFLEVRAIGGDNPCWLNPEWLDITGDLSTVQPIRPEDVKLPFSPYYPNGLSSVMASRSGSQVTIWWSPYVLKAGDDSEQYPYLVEAWVCRAGQIVFEPSGSYQTTITILDEPGCAEPSHARVYAVEKHGYTPWIEVPWQQP